MSDPTTPPGEPDSGDSVSPEESPGTDSGPIDVRELLESTRKLFEPEDIQRAMAQAGYAPESSSEVSSEESDSGNSADRLSTLESAPDTSDTTDTGEPEDSMVESVPGPVTAEEEVVAVEPEGTEAPTEDSSPLSADEPVQEVVVEAIDADTAEEEPALRGVNVLSIVAFVLAIALSPLAVVFGYIALGQTRRARQRGETLALWAIGLGWLVFAAWVVVIASLVWIGWQQGITVESLRQLIELFSLP